ncbi:long-chain fatty acid--CoA ligase [Achromobacter sp. GG226]|uniref:long-chain fatty acid--CoA ligase n=1 Tax=Verticiella alkaliphila TaxID=2779529 RepID=UPI001C0BD522|nr:long-chain fatty acid--CoA ligase [Verticiella sp. GG226]MBU4609041.1 long-chain fatty acid--CoA ligase [Verticiella sp. GG226]
MFDRHLPFWPPHALHTLSVPQTSLCYNLDVSATRYPGKTAMVYYGQAIDYARFLREVEALAGYLAGPCGVGRGDRVLLNVQNSPQFLIGYYAILRANAVVVPANPMLRTDELRYLLQDSGANTAIFGQEGLAEWQPLMADGSLHHGIAAAYSSYLPAEPVGALPDIVAAPVAALPSVSSPHSLVRWDDALGAALPPPVAQVGPDDLAVLPYTSGTTGAPKGCMHTHGTVMSTAAAQSVWVASAGDRVALATLPMFHVTGMQGGMNVPILGGDTVVIMTRWDRNTAALLIQNYRITAFTAITTMLVDFLGNPELGRYDLSSLRHLSGGGAAMPQALAERLRQVIGLDFVEGYGLSETIAPTHINPVHRPKRQCAGIPIFGVDARVVDVETLREVGVGETGEIVVNGPQIFKGYWGKPQATEESFFELDGKRFFRTGDLGHYDEEGYFFITDRLKRMINASGYKVWPAEVEAMLYGHPAIAEACVIASRDAHRGETVKAVVVLRDDAIDTTRPDDITEWAREHMASYKVPRIVEFADSLPKTATGKVFWRKLQEHEYANQGKA